MGRGQKKVCGQRNQFANGIKTNCKISNATNTNGNGFQRSLSSNFNKQQSSKEKYVEEYLPFTGQKIPFSGFPTQSPICGGDDGLPQQLDGITFSKWRAESIKGYGNAIVPQVAMELFKIIEAHR
jgi:DNA (cytosine-5)-methyltransferase 1